MPGHALSVAQQFMTHNALVIVLTVMLTRTDVKLLSSDV
jgi:hypothetical protein